MAEISSEEAMEVYKCLKPAMEQAYAKAGVETVAGYMQWPNLAKAPYQSATHGSRYVNNYADPQAAPAYAKYEEVGTMPAGSTLAKDSFVVSPDGATSVGPLFVMQKMEEGFDAGTHDWRYTMIMPGGTIFGRTGGEGSDKVAFCADCHNAVAEAQDALYFLPSDFRVQQE